MVRIYFKRDDQGRDPDEIEFRNKGGSAHDIYRNGEHTGQVTAGGGYHIGNDDDERDLYD